ncbi:MAG: hypothetical protein SF069_03345 [Phycisphaerae bacterium]|nr:hypothetical protein [Phycisphaerae bacterium]
MSRERNIVIHDRELRLTADRQVLHSVASGCSTRDASGEELATALNELMQGQPQRRVQSIIVPASWCYLQRFDLPQRRPSRAALRYALEEFLPEDIDALACDFQRVGPTTYLSAAIPDAALNRLCAAAAQAGIAFDAVELRLARPAATETAQTCVTCDADHWAAVSTNPSGPMSAVVLRFAVDTPLEERCHALQAREELSADAIEFNGITSEAKLAEFRRHLSGVAAVHSGSIVHPGACVRFNLGAERLTVDAAPLHRSVQRLLIASLASLVLLAAALGIRSLHRERQSALLAEWEVSLFQQIFPNEPNPSAPALRIQAARKQWESQANLRRESSPDAVDPLLALAEVLNAIPSDLRLHVDELRIDDRSLSLRGSTREHADAERIAKALDAQPTLICPPPRTDRLREGGVRLSLVARFAAETKQP